jgi:hypothetical protein
MKIKYNVAKIKPEVTEMMVEYLAEGETSLDMDLYWMLVFSYKSELDTSWPGVTFHYHDKTGVEDTYTVGQDGLDLWNKTYKSARKDVKRYG